MSRLHGHGLFTTSSLQLPPLGGQSSTPRVVRGHGGGDSQTDNGRPHTITIAGGGEGRNPKGTYEDLYTALVKDKFWRDYGRTSFAKTYNLDVEP